VIQIQIGERIGKIRMERGLSKIQFGKMIGVSGQYVGLIEKGAHRPSAELIAKICFAAGVSADYILFGTVNSIDDPETAAALYGISYEQIQIALDIVKKVARFVNSGGGNEALIQEVLSQQRANARNRALMLGYGF